jgi:lipoprotein-anchoring transpeptidase ErfK/SrfK
VFLVIDLGMQRAVLYRNGVPIAASSVSTGRRGRGTPTGVFTILQKEVRHRSRTYDDAPMPYMQRLTWKGVAMHAGHVAGYPASHGCIRLPRGFAKKLYAVTRIGTPVMIRA